MIFVATFSTFSHGQVQFGIEGGVNSAQFNDNISSDARIGFNIGLTGNFYIADWLTFQPAVQYSSQGDKDTYQYANDITNIYNVEQINKLNYVNIPVMGLLRLGKTGGYISGGAMFGFLISASSDVKYSGGTQPPQDEVHDIKEFINTNDFGWVFGAGWEFSNGLVLSMRYYLGQKEVLVEGIDPDTGAYYLPQGKNQVIQLNLGFLFGN